MNARHLITLSVVVVNQFEIDQNPN